MVRVAIQLHTGLLLLAAGPGITGPQLSEDADPVASVAQVAQLPLTPLLCSAQIALVQTEGIKLGELLTTTARKTVCARLHTSALYPPCVIGAVVK